MPPSPTYPTTTWLVPAELGAQRSSAGDADTGTDDAVATDEAALEVGHVHRTAAAAVGSAGPPEQLGHECRRRDAHRQCVVMTAVRARGEVTGLQCRRDTDRDGLLPEREVDTAGDLAAQRERIAARLEFADKDHVAEPAQGFVGRDAVELHRAVLGGQSRRRPGRVADSVRACSGSTRTWAALTGRDAVGAAAFVGRTVAVAAEASGRRGSRRRSGSRPGRLRPRPPARPPPRRFRPRPASRMTVNATPTGTRSPGAKRCRPRMPSTGASSSAFVLSVSISATAFARGYDITGLLRPRDEQGLGHRKSDRRDGDVSHRSS